MSIVISGVNDYWEGYLVGLFDLSYSHECSGDFDLGARVGREKREELINDKLDIFILLNLLKGFKNVKMAYLSIKLDIG